ncbi:uncharacterized protein LOC119681788 [Teleopsis dalmanni]|uniref:uncharacterized protein LOC119681788 n=1 Tax=Teleopsis dalmanni TaxID=139649 RepID=UPI0018CF5671|nr:uncharacterized protein LOC119681788 [Teleopsis dalmanni]
MLAKTITEDKPTTNEIQNAQNNEINEIVTASDAAEIATTSSNQETETVAMANDLMNVTPTNLNPITTKTNTTAENVTEIVAETTPTHNTTITTKTNATVLTSNDASQSPSVATGKCFVMPTSASSSLKKKKRNKNAHAKQFTNGTLDTEVVGGAAMTTTGADTMPTSIKTSWSMSSLPYDEKQEIRDVIEAKLRVERPYNSLKKTTERRIVETNVCHTLPNSKNHRYSWGSGYSHSSSSLHSNATLGLGSGKDDLWAVIQTNYNYIMDTNLLDTCKEARCEIEGEPTVQAVDFCYKILNETNRNESFCEDPRDLRKWLREMEQKLSNAPSLSQAAHFSCAELQRQQAEYSAA